MEKATSRINATLFFRVGTTNDVKALFDANQIRFGCPANWIDSAFRGKNQTIGDYAECVFAHLSKTDPRVNSQTDVMGKPMGDNLLITVNSKGNDCWLSYMPTILTPTLCFYSVHIEEERTRHRKKNSDDILAFSLDRYCDAMQCKQKESSFLFIIHPEQFIEELKVEIPNAVEANRSKLTSERFYGDYNANDSLFYRDIDYLRHSRDELFYDNPGKSEEIFWKMPEYAYQSEVRLIIPNINFQQGFGYANPYDSRENSLLVNLPHLKDYAKVFSASDAHWLVFDNFDDSHGTMDFSIRSTL